MTDSQDPVEPSVVPAEVLARFESARPRLWAVASRIVGPADADDAVQEAYLRLSRTDLDGIDNLEGWLTTVTVRLCLNLLRDRSRRESELDPHVSSFVVRSAPLEPGPEAGSELVESVGEALMVVLDTLTPAERVAFVLHDVFRTPFEEVASVLDRSPAAARQLASRARRRVSGEEGSSAAGSTALGPASPEERRSVVDAFFRAARAGDMAGLLALLDPAVVLRADGGPTHPGAAVVRGAGEVAGRALMFAAPDRVIRPVWVGVDPAVVVTVETTAVAVMRFFVLAGRIVRIDALTDQARLVDLELP